MATRYLRNKDLIDQSRLDKITVIGAGGIGSALLQNAAIMGFGKITVWDPDTLEEHNLSTTSWPERFLNKQKVSSRVVNLNQITNVLQKLFNKKKSQKSINNKINKIGQKILKKNIDEINLILSKV